MRLWCLTLSISITGLPSHYFLLFLIHPCLRTLAHAFSSVLVPFLQISTVPTLALFSSCLLREFFPDLLVLFRSFYPFCIFLQSTCYHSTLWYIFLSTHLQNVNLTKARVLFFFSCLDFVYCCLSKCLEQCLAHSRYTVNICEIHEYTVKVSKP